MNKIIENKLRRLKIIKKANQVILVIKDKLYLYTKVNNVWKSELETNCIFGKNGFSANRKEGDGTTPIGIFKILYAFGTEDGVDTNLKYRKIKQTSYFSCDTNKEDEYNTWVESDVKIAGEHLIDYPKQYHYAFALGFNINPIIIGNGSAIFLHVRGERDSTEGCIAVEEEVMKYLFKKITNNAYTIIAEDVKQIKYINDK